MYSRVEEGEWKGGEGGRKWVERLYSRHLFTISNCTHVCCVVRQSHYDNGAIKDITVGIILAKTMGNTNAVNIPRCNGTHW